MQKVKKEEKKKGNSNKANKKLFRENEFLFYMNKSEWNLKMRATKVSTISFI